MDSGAALATVIGIIVEVPVTLSVVRIVKAPRGWYEAGTTQSARAGGATLGMTARAPLPSTAKKPQN